MKKLEAVYLMGLLALILVFLYLTPSNQLLSRFSSDLAFEARGLRMSRHLLKVNYAYKNSAEFKTKEANTGSREYRVYPDRIWFKNSAQSWSEVILAENPPHRILMVFEYAQDFFAVMSSGSVLQIDHQTYQVKTAFKLKGEIHTATVDLKNPLGRSSLFLFMTEPGFKDAILVKISLASFELAWIKPFKRSWGPTAVFASPDQVLLAHSEGLLYALNASDGQQLWKTPIPVLGPIRPQIRIHGENVYALFSNSQFLVLSRLTGQLLWQTIVPVTMNNLDFSINEDKNWAYSAKWCLNLNSALPCN